MLCRRLLNGQKGDRGIAGMTGTYTPAKAIHDVVRFSPGGKKNRGKEEKGERTWPPAEGRHDVVWFFVRREEELRKRRKRRANMTPTEGSSDAMQLSAGREE